MKHPAIVQACVARLRPSRWGLLVVFLLLLALVRFLLGDTRGLKDGPHLIRGVGLLLGLVLLAPAPWQWTGDDRPRAPFLRGLGQALVFNAAWLGVALLFFGPGRPFFQVNFGPGQDPAVQFFLHRLHAGLGIPLAIAPLVGLLPFSLGMGWFLADLEAARAERTEVLNRNLALESTAREARTQALRAQLDPHVLYNALGAMAELVRENPGAAEEALLDLSDFYRRLTRLYERDWIELAEERSLLEQYLAIETYRLGDRLQVSWAWPDDLMEVRIPPLLLLPLVENALKHGLAAVVQGGALHLEASLRAGELTLRVANTGAPLGDAFDPQGTGLRNLRDRLALLGGSRFDLRREPPWTVAELVLGPGALGRQP